MANQNSTQRTGSTRGYYIMALVSVLAAIGTHFYLTQHHLGLKYGHGVSDSICNLTSTFSCTAASASKFSELFGVPMALWGAVTNFALLILALLYPMADEQNKRKSRNTILLISGFVTVVSIVMALISVTQLTQYCPFCILTYVLSFLAFFGFWKGLYVPTTKSATAAGGAPLSIQTLVGVAVGILVLSWVVHHGMRKSYVGNNQGYDASINAYIEEWKTGPQLTIAPVNPLVKGKADSPKLQLVEFADFRCGHCKTAAPTLEAFVKSNPDVSLTFQTYPLDGECNPAIPSSNGASCLLARAFVCAQKSDKGWQAHDWIFAHQEQMVSLEAVKKNVEQMATELGLDPAKINECTASEEVRKIIEQQAALGSQLNIRGTPTVFANGKLLPGGQLLPVLQRAYSSVQ